MSSDNQTGTLMEKEAREAPEVVASQLHHNTFTLEDLSSSRPLSSLKMVVTCARGSSDHAAAYAKYLFEIMLGVPVLSLRPSIGSIYMRPMNLSDSLFLVISQSGKSPDLISCALWAKKNGAYVVALINAPNTPLGKETDLLLPLHAGEEKSVAATKSYIASLTATAHIVAQLSGDIHFLENLQNLPKKLAAACQLNWDQAIIPFASSDDLLVVGRGLCYGIALEAALKFKETASIHAEGFSSAELMHGPLALVRERYPILVFSQQDETRKGVQQLIDTLRNKGACVFAAEEGKETKWRLPVINDIHPYLSPIAMIQRFYLLVNQISLARGFNPDQPEHLQKETRTQ